MKESHIAVLKNFIFDKQPLSQDEFYVLRKDLEALIKQDFTEQNIPNSLNDVIIGISNLYSSEAHKKFKSDPEYLFQLGAFYALTNILDSDLRKKQELEDMKKLAKVIAANGLLFDFVETIVYNSAIKKSELEDKYYNSGKMGYGDFCKFYVELKSNKYILVRIGVDEEYIYITELGEKLYKTAKELNGEQK